MRLDPREFAHRGEAVLVPESDAERNALAQIGSAGSVVIGQLDRTPDGKDLYLRMPYADSGEEFFVDVFIGNGVTAEVHHKNLARAGCQLSEIKKVVVFDSLVRARLNGFDPCGWCFRSEK